MHALCRDKGIAGPDYIVSFNARYDIESLFPLPSPYIGIGGIGYHVYKTAAAASAAFLG